MTISPSSMTTAVTPVDEPAMPATTYLHRVHHEAMASDLNALVTEMSAALSVQALTGALDAGIDSLSTILRAVPVHEGRLLERGIGLIAGCNPDLTVLTDNLRLPVTATAMQLVEKNAAHLYRSLTLDADSGGRKSYTPDILVLNRRTRIAHVVDVKRSLSSYEVSRITALKSRMLAAALVVPDLLYKEHRRLVAEEVRVVILNAESQRSDIEGGIWPLGHLDHLLEIDGAGETMARLRQMFCEQIANNWDEARLRMTTMSARCRGTGQGTSAGQPCATEQATTPAKPAANDAIGKHGAWSGRMPRIGFARMPASSG